MERNVDAGHTLRNGLLTVSIVPIRIFLPAISEGDLVQQYDRRRKRRIRTKPKRYRNDSDTNPSTAEGIYNGPNEDPKPDFDSDFEPQSSRKVPKRRNLGKWKWAIPTLRHRANLIPTQLKLIHFDSAVGSTLPFSCQACKEKFATRSYIVRHIREKHEEHRELRRFNCPSCDRQMVTQRALNSHVEKLHNPANPKLSIYKCKDCELQFQDPRSLKRHFCSQDEPVSAENLRAVSISTGPSVGKALGRKRKHDRSIELTKVHGSEEEQECSVCFKRCKNKTALQMHMKIHVPVRPFQCQYCPKNFAVEHALVIHERRHTGEKPYGCPLCDKRFVASGEVKPHIRFHTQEKPFKCTYKDCGKGFARKGHLTEHIRTHTGEKFHKCRVCEKTFSQFSNCMKHEKLVHFFFEPREKQADVERVSQTTTPIRPRIVTKKKSSSNHGPVRKRQRTKKLPQSPALSVSVPNKSGLRVQPRRSARSRALEFTSRTYDESAEDESEAEMGASPIDDNGSKRIFLEEVMIKDEPVVEEAEGWGEPLEVSLDEIKVEASIPPGISDNSANGGSDASVHCPYCYISFQSFELLEEHAVLRHVDSSKDRIWFKCPHMNCSNGFTTINELKSHQRAYHSLTYT